MVSGDERTGEQHRRSVRVCRVLYATVEDRAVSLCAEERVRDMVRRLRRAAGTARGHRMPGARGSSGEKEAPLRGSAPRLTPQEPPARTLRGDAGGRGSCRKNTAFGGAVGGDRRASGKRGLRTGCRAEREMSQVPISPQPQVNLLKRDNASFVDSGLYTASDRRFNRTALYPPSDSTCLLFKKELPYR